MTLRALIANTMAVPVSRVAAVGAAAKSWGQASAKGDSLQRYRADIKLFAAIAAIVVLSQSALLLYAPAGVYANAAALVILAALALRSSAARFIAIAASLLPLATLASLALHQQDPLIQADIFYGVLLLPALIYRYLFDIEQPIVRPAMDWKRYFVGLPIFIVAGQLLAVSAYVLLAGTFPFAGIDMPIVVAAAVLFAIAEEVYFRGLLQDRASQVMRPVLAIALTTTLYAAMTLPFDNLAVTAFAVMANVVLSIAYYFRPNLALTIAANVVSKLLFLWLLVVL